MPKVLTKIMDTMVRRVPQAAAGLHDPESRKTWFFEDIRPEGVPARYIAIGRSPKCDIRVRDEGVSYGHAVLEQTARGYKLTDHGSTNGTYIDGRLVRGPVIVRVGMVVALGSARLIGVDGDGRAPVFGDIVTMSDFCRALVRVYGNPSKAAERLDGKPSREYIRRRNLPKRLRP